MCGRRLPGQNWQTPPEPPPARPLRSSAGSRDFSDDVPASASYLLEDDEPEPSHRGRLYAALVLSLVALAILLAGSSPAVRAWLSGYVARSAAQQEAAKPPAPAAEETIPPVDASASLPRAPRVEAPPVAIDQPAPATTEAAAKPSPSIPENEQPKPSFRKPRVIAQPKAVLPVAPSPAENLTTVGQRYLDGDGVAQDCALARKNLLASAERSSARAQSLLGAMYTTGRCAPRDLPTAYRWFAKSLHNAPNDAQVAANLEQVWKKMTPSERQLALKK